MSAFTPDHAGARVRPSPNYGDRRGTVDLRMIVLHYTGMESGQAAEDRLCDPASEVSSHYLVHEDGGIVQMVRERDRAWHAGKSCWHGVTDNNSQSIGIEIVNPGHGLGYPPFPRRQIAAVVELCRGIIGRHQIRPEMVLGHSDIAVGRKVDPGERFPWAILQRNGVGHFVAPARHRTGAILQPGDENAAVKRLQQTLRDYGYDIEISGRYDLATESVVAAFQRHFRPGLVNGVADFATVETLRRLVAALAKGHDTA